MSELKAILDALRTTRGIYCDNRENIGNFVCKSAPKGVLNVIKRELAPYQRKGVLGGKSLALAAKEFYCDHRAAIDSVVCGKEKPKAPKMGIAKKRASIKKR